ncbi:hypothetical protein CALVIDRAFT_534609 [Calocera viscosa TUFC12733]|uniref:RING-type domain-containing protein n=1 Tax=Calocera viscosa (strain TUFC12733) TaxID=1330018 RepID=A0A167PSI2_CALVF|nr:hypothetical protein CALVIDRAFT_534609 [Calocera viscosa TUFC12733]
MADRSVYSHNRPEEIDLTQSSPLNAESNTRAGARPRTRSRTAHERVPVDIAADAAALPEDVIDIDDDEGEEVQMSGALHGKHRRQRTTPPTAGPSTAARLASVAASTPEPPGAYRTRRRVAPSRTPAPVAGPSRRPHEVEEGEIVFVGATPPASRRGVRSSARLSAASRPSINGIILPPRGVSGVDPDGPPRNFYLPPDPPDTRSRPRRRPAPRQAGPSNPKKRKLAPINTLSVHPDGGDVFSSTGLAPGSGGTSPLTSMSGASNPGTPQPSPSSAPTTLPTPPSPPPNLQPLTSYTCPICFSPPAHATITPCGHLMCGECLYSSVRANLERAMQMPAQHVHPQCPVCRADIHLAGTRFDGGGKNCAVGMWAFEEIELR